jgi:hypothetical protein
MIAKFRRQSVLARADGYAGLAAELGATVVCAYRRSSFDTTALASALAVHPMQSGQDEEPPYRLVSGSAQLVA